jgi:predicted MFS family arabinose efflux permease
MGSWRVAQLASMNSQSSGHLQAPARLVAIVCAAQVLVQIGAYFWPALLPGLTERWALTYTEAGWITAVFYGSYMVSVPILVPLTDRIDPRRIYLFGVGLTIAGHLYFGFAADGFWSAIAGRALAGIGWAGTYMTGLKLLADLVDERMMSRAVTAHAAGIGIAGALSFATGDLIAHFAGWQSAFFAAGASAAVAWTMVSIAVPRRRAPLAPPLDGGTLFDFRPVLRNRSAMAYALAYCVHTLEMNALRGWAVAFLVYVAASTGTTDTLMAPTLVATCFALLGTAASVSGNEAAIRFGRRRLIHAAMAGSVLIAAALAVAGTASYAAAVILLTIYGAVVWLDSSSLTAGAAGTAEPSRRGATLAVHSTLGYAGGFVGPLAVGWVLDLYGGMSTAAWAAAFLMIALLTLIALTIFWLMQPRELKGDRGTTVDA